MYILQPWKKNPDSYFCMVIFTNVLHIKLSPYKQSNCVWVHSPVHEKVIFCQFLTFLEALKDVGLALHKFEDGIRTFEHKEMGCRGKNGEIGQFLAELVFWLSCKISFFTISNHTNGAAEFLIWILHFQTCKYTTVPTWVTDLPRSISILRKYVFTLCEMFTYPPMMLLVTF